MMKPDDFFKPYKPIFTYLMIAESACFCFFNVHHTAK